MQRIEDIVGRALADRLGLDLFTLAEHHTLGFHRVLAGGRPGCGRGWIVDRSSFEAGTRRGQAIMIGSTNDLVDRGSPGSSKI